MVDSFISKPDVVEGTDDERVWSLPCWDLTETSKRDDGIDLLKDKQALQRLTETAEKAKMDLSSLTQTNISLPFITATADGPKHIETTITRAKSEELCSTSSTVLQSFPYLNILTLAMAGIVINLHLPIPIVLSCGLKIRLAENYFAQFMFMAGVSQILVETNYQITMAVAYNTTKVMQDAFLLVTAVKKICGYICLLFGCLILLEYGLCKGFGNIVSIFEGNSARPILGRNGRMVEVIW
ncbi:hypothetical protein Syun_009586 [Stephania yunnanensis]|uniref:Uncharacterized protein n=1 Tax=Stephania yunnanensis TaxID=152371 RepID=A0AAP0KHA3_9MAGN